MNKKIKFIINAILALILEYSLIFIFFFLIFKVKLIISLIITLGIGLIFTITSFVTKININNYNNEDNDDHYYDEFKDLINKVNKEYHLNLKLLITDMQIDNPAANYNNNIIINSRTFKTSLFSRGIIGHEIGHAVSGISKYLVLSIARPSWIMGRIYWVVLCKIMQKSPKMWIIKLNYYFYVLINLINIIFIFKPMREDEIEADSNAVKFGYGEELRCYYGKFLRDYYINDEAPLSIKMDHTHPSIYDTIDNLNHLLKIKKEYLNLYYANNTLYLERTKTMTLTIPDFITSLSNRAITSDTIKKLNLNKVKEMKSNSIRCNNLEELIIPSDTNITIDMIKNLKSLKKISVSNESLYNELVLQMNNVIIKKI